MWLYYLSDSLNPELTSFKPALVQGKTAEGLSLPMGWYALVNRRSAKNLVAEGNWHINPLTN